MIMLKRIFDLTASLVLLLLLSPVLFMISLWIFLDSNGGIFYKQIRVGKHSKDFSLFKFRTMKTDSDSKGLLTVGNRDPRITKSGYFLRKYKLDELPQLFNVFLGDMSLVGPRPEVRKYVDHYTDEQLQVLSVKPGITDWASIEYVDENQLLANAENPEKLYIEEIMPAKLKLNLKYINSANLIEDIKILLLTFSSIFFGKRN